MKKVIIMMAAFALSFPFGLRAQKEKQEQIEIEEKIEKKEIKEKKVNKEKPVKIETQEIVIRKKGEKELKLKLEIDGDNIIVNGKPLAEFKDDEVVINKRKIIVRDGNHVMHFNVDPGNFTFNEEVTGYWGDGKEEAKGYWGDGKKEVKGYWGDGKKVIKPFLGVTTEKASSGAKITEIIEESAAEKGGLKKDDIITKVDGKVIKDGESLSGVIGSKKPKDVVLVNYLRNGKAGKVNVTLGERKIKTPMAMTFGGPHGDVRAFSIPKTVPGSPNIDMMYDENFHGMDMENMFGRQKKLGLKIQDTEEGGNVKVIEVEEGSAAEKAGLKKDDIITEIGGVKIENTDDARKELQPSEKKSAYSIKAKRGGTEMNFEVKFPKQLKTANL